MTQKKSSLTKKKNTIIGTSRLHTDDGKTVTNHGDYIPAAPYI